MTITDIQVSPVNPTDRPTGAQRAKSVLRSWVAAYIALYAPTVGSTTIDASSQLRWVPVR